MERWRVGWRSLHEGKSTSGLYLSLIQLKGHTFGLDKFNKSKLIFEVFFSHNSMVLDLNSVKLLFTQPFKSKGHRNSTF